MAFIETVELTHVYQTGNSENIKALDKVSLAIESGEFVAIVGANGSGKSTLAKHFNALLLPTDGRVLIAGKDTQEAGEIYRIRQQVSMVFQNPDNQLIAAVVEDDVAFGPENLGVEPAEISRRVEESLAAVGMTELRGQPPHMLSGGQKQRVAIAGALAMQTRGIIFDEATAMLDPEGRKEVMDAILQLRKDLGITVVIITHFMDEAMLADRIIVMQEGKLAADGAPREIFAKTDFIRQAGLELPLATEVAEYLREAGMRLPKSILTDDELVEAVVK